MGINFPYLQKKGALQLPSIIFYDCITTYEPIILESRRK